MQNLSQIEQSAAELRRLKCKMAAILDIQGGIHGPFCTLWDFIFYAHTKFGEDILIGGRDMPPKRNF